MPEENGVELRWLLAVIRRWWWLIVAFSLVAGVIAFVVMSRRVPVYSASATLLIDRGQAVVSGDVADVRASEELAQTYSKMMTGRPVLEATIEKLGLNTTAELLAARVKVALIPDSQLIRLTVQGYDPAEAALIANTIPELFVSRVQALQAERYAETLAAAQARMEDLPRQIEETQSRVATLNANKIEREAKLTRLGSLLEQYQNDYGSLKERHEALRLEAAQAVDSVIIVEAPQLPAISSQSPYSASVSLMVNSDSASTALNQPLLNTYSEILTGQSLLATTISQLGLQETPGELAARVRAAPVPNTQLIRLFVEDPEPSRAASIANTIAELFVAQVEAFKGGHYAEALSSMQEDLDELSAQMENTQTAIDTLQSTEIQEEAELTYLEGLLAGYREDYRTLQGNQQSLSLTVSQLTDNVQIIEAAQVPSYPVQSPTESYTLLAAVVGAMVAVGLAFLVEYLDDTIRTPEEVQQALGLETMGVIGQLANEKAELVVTSQPRSPGAEAFRVLATNIRFANVDHPLRTLLLTSPSPREGKSLTTANLAAALAESGLDVVVVDADLRVPRQHRLFGLDGRSGLTDSLLEGSLDGRLQPTQVEGVRVLPSGGLPLSPTGIMSSRKLLQLLEGLAEKADVVLLDSPPTLPVADTSMLVPAIDGVLLIVQAGRTRRQEAQNATKGLRQVGANVVGVVLTQVPMAGRKAYAYKYYTEENGGTNHRAPSWRQRLLSWPALFGKRR